MADNGSDTQRRVRGDAPDGGRAPARRLAGSFALAYAGAAALWILLSDRLVTAAFQDPASIATVSIAKGWLFVGVTGLCFYLALRAAERRSGRRPVEDDLLQAESGDRARRLLILGFAAAMILGAGLGAMQYTTNRQQEEEYLKLQAITDLRAEQIAHWVGERRGDARTAAAEPVLSALAAGWLKGDAAAGATLQALLQAHRRADTYVAVALLHVPSGRAVSAGTWPGGEPAALEQAIARAVRTRAASDTDLYRTAQDGPVVIDFVVPIPTGGGEAPDAVIVLRVDAAAQIYPLLRKWPLPSESGETVLFRRDGDFAVALSPLRHLPDAPLNFRRELPAGLTWAQVERGTAEGTGGRPPKRVDYRGVRAITWFCGVPGTHWFVAAKLDEEELLAAVRRDATWIGLAALLALAAAAFAIELLHQQRTLRLTRALQERREEVLRNAQLLRDIAGSSTDAIIAKDAGGRYLLMNEAAHRMIGRSPEDALGRSDEDLFPLEIAKRIREDDLRVMAGGKTVTYEETIESRAGEIHLLTTKGPLRSSDGSVTGVFGISRDVTERARVAAELDRHRNHLAMLVRQRTAELEAANLELQRRAEEIRDLYDSSPCGYDTIDTTGLVLRMNDTELRWLGYSREEIVGRKRIVDLMTPASAARFPASFESFLRTGTIHDVPVEFVRRDGSVLPVVVNATAIRDAAGEITEVRSTVVDATERRMREQEVARLADELARRAAEAESASRAKSAFLANMSHEIRTPLNAIVGLTYLVRRSNVDDAQADRLDKIVAAAEHLLAVINDVLDISKVEAGKLSLESGPVEVHTLMEQVGAWAATRSREKGIDLGVETSADVPELVVGDATRLRQMLLNYASNAVKFTEQGRIVLRASVAERSTDSVLLRFEVEDTGVGVDTDALPRLFNAFEQGDDSTTRRYGGTGLGLAINRLIAREMGGDVGVTSTSGVGSRFWLTARFSLPAPGSGLCPDSVPDADGGPGEATLRSWWLGTRVLLAEDNPINREVAEELLTALGLGVDAAPDGAIAVAKARATSYALILMDVQMPVMDGLDAARAIRALPRHARTPIVAMTAAATLEDREAAAGAGMSDFIAKPFTPAALRKLLLRWLPHSPSGHAPSVGAASATPVTPAPSYAPVSAEEDGTAPITGLEIVRRLAGVPGLDPMRGLPYSGHDGERYLRFLRRFVESARTELASARAALAGGDPVTVRRALHSLKGAAAFAGAVELRTLAAAAESRATADAALADVEQVLADLERGVVRLARAVSETERADAAAAAGESRAPHASAAAGVLRAPQASAASRLEMNAVLARLVEYLDEGDTSAALVLEEDGDVLHAALGAERMAELRRRVGSFEYEAAAEIARGALGTRTA